MNPANCQQALRTWTQLNDALRRCSEQTAKDLLAAELAGKNRKVFVSRIHSRLNRLRAKRERRELSRG